MSCQIDFFIRCPQYVPYEHEPYHAFILMFQTPDFPEPFFAYPNGCGGYRNCLTCNWCLKRIREMFIREEINFYRDPQSIYGFYHVTLHRPVRPQSEEPASTPPESV